MSQNHKPITEEYLVSKGFILSNNTYELKLPNDYILSVIPQGELYFPSVKRYTDEDVKTGYIEIQNNIQTMIRQDAKYQKIDNQDLFDEFLNYIKTANFK